ncbi:MAG: hypothetical protein K2Y56_00490 [Methylobacterium sp.]|uniref:hypothetical protein n=1 Tax=Methylobacterium sp. TaxID=409 RepID=UPI0025E4BD6B|nr:hypothetical protein [Methylobacterium sp.]MBX9930016.1 hypothetical protein [Methylobacterium sp.]
MATERHILRLLLAAIVMIAAYMMPSVASAHEGHGAKGHGSHHSHQVHDLKPSGSTEVATTSAMSSVRPAAAVMAPETTEACSPRCLACTGCSVIGCCGTAVILAFSGGLPLRIGHAVVLIAATSPTPSGIGPEALAEPPRSHA